MQPQEFNIPLEPVDRDDIDGRSTLNNDSTLDQSGMSGLGYINHLNTSVSSAGSGAYNGNNIGTTSTSNNNIKPLSQTFNHMPISDFGTFSIRGKKSGNTNVYHSTLEYLDRTSEETATFLEKSRLADPLSWAVNSIAGGESFSYRNLKAHHALAYFIFQILAVYAQFQFLESLGVHSAAYEGFIDRECRGDGDTLYSKMRNGICLGSKESWSNVYENDVIIGSSSSSSSSSSSTTSVTSSTSNSLDSDSVDLAIGRDASFTFTTTSSIPTFLIGIEPQSPNSDVKYTVRVTKGTGLNVVPVNWKHTNKMLKSSNSNGRNLPLIGLSTSVFSEDVPEYMRTKNQNNNDQNPQKWEVKIQLVGDPRKFTDNASFHVYVADSQIPHLALVDQQPRCHIGQSWENFVEKRAPFFHGLNLFTEGYVHLFYSWICCVVFLQALALVLVAYRFVRVINSSTSKLLSRIGLMKFVFVDIPQQLAVMIYLHSWYMNDGIKCQMCVMERQYCSHITPTLGSNAVGVDGLSAMTTSSSSSSLMRTDSNINSNSNSLDSNSYNNTSYESDDALSWPNLCLLLSLLLSAASTQLLIIDKAATTGPCEACETDDDELDCCLLILWRIAAFAVCTLPLSLSFLMYGRSTLLKIYMSPLLYTVVLLSALLGICAVMMLVASAVTPKETLTDDDF